MNELFNVKDKVVVITGGAGILGKGIAAYLAHPVKRTDGQRRCGSTARDRRQHYKSECRASIRRVVECYLTDERVTVES